MAMPCRMLADSGIAPSRAHHETAQTAPRGRDVGPRAPERLPAGHDAAWRQRALGGEAAIRSRGRPRRNPAVPQTTAPRDEALFMGLICPRVAAV